MVLCSLYYCTCEINDIYQNCSFTLIQLCREVQGWLGLVLTSFEVVSLSIVYIAM